MTREETRNIANVMTAFACGDEIECCYKLDRHEDWKPSSSPIWNWTEYNYRVKPVTKYRFWTPEEIVGQKIKHKMTGSVHLVLACSSSGSWCVIGGLKGTERIEYDPEQIYAMFINAVDNRPCGVIS
jgi:hypothetical protein